MSLRRKLVLAIFVSVIAVLSSIQVYIDYMHEKKIEDRSEETDKKSDFLIFIEIEDKTLYLLQDGNLIKKYPIASGAPDTPSPLGAWEIVNKGDWGEGFGGRWMGLNVPWGKYGIHGTTSPNSIGWEVSHGCIRMYNRDVKELYKIVPHGTPVVIVNGPFGPFGRGFRSIEPGDRGADVMAIQQRLKELGYFKGWVSGIYDDDLKYAVHKFQKDNNLPVTNTVNKKTWEKMGFIEFE